MIFNLPIELLACPACGGALEPRGACLCCAGVSGEQRSGCGASYAAVEGVPILMTPEDRERFGTRLEEGEGAAMAGRYGARANTNLAARLKRALAPPLPLVHNRQEPRLPCPPGSYNLWIGGGGARTPGFINLDVGLFTGVDIVGNAERLPFRGCALDSIECDAVLEHVERPDEVARQMYRTLKPGGLLHAVVPFCHPYHAYPADFRRWTPSGFAAWIAGFGFEISAAGVRTGPTATLLTFALEYVKALFGGGVAGKAAYAAAGWLLFPFRYLNLWLNKRPRSEGLANHVYVLARKP